MIRSSIQVLRAGILAGLFLSAAHEATAADVTSYSVRKGLIYEQTSASAPTPFAQGPGAFVARANVDIAAIESVGLATPSQFFPNFTLDTAGDHYEFFVPAPEADVDTFFPSGSYTFAFEGTSATALNFVAGAKPSPVPQVSNFAAAQDINPAQNFTLNFSAFTGAGAGDSTEFEILSNGSTLFSSLPSGTSVVIPAGTLIEGESYDARLRFVHNVASDSSSIPGATGTAGYFKETQFSVGTTGSGGGGDDTTPPTLAFAFPANGATGVAVSSQIIFSFSESMAPQQQIQWSANVTPANFSYTWQNDETLFVTYNGSLPANATISYTLVGGATGFKDLAGNPLSPLGAQGGFSTGTGGGGGTNNPCLSTNEPPAGAGGGFLSKSAQYLQTGNSIPTLETEDPVSAFATYRAATNTTVTSVRVTGPNNLNLALSNLLGTFFVFQDFATVAAVDTAFPAGTYTITATGAGSGTVTVPTLATLPVPKINNLVEFAAFDPTKDFTLQFSPFTGAGANDTIFISITGLNDEHFYAPDFCLNRALPNTATSVVIPANTFKTTGKLTGSISFSRTSSNTNAIPNTSLTAAASVTTSFETTLGSNPGSGVRWTSFVVNPDGSIIFTAQAPADKTAKIQMSTDLIAWTDVSTSATTGGIVTFTADPKAAKKAFYRLLVQ